MLNMGQSVHKLFARISRILPVSACGWCENLAGKVNDKADLKVLTSSPRACTCALA